MKLPLVTAAALFGLIACVDVDKGETAFYGSPCTGLFADLLRCAMESGGADPETGQSQSGGQRSGGEPKPATCEEICTILAGCSSSIDPAECTTECQSEAIPQSTLDCIRDNGCNTRACLGGN